jgi:hypothetical protein
MRFGNPSKKTRVVASTKGHAIELPGRGSLTEDKLPTGAVLSADGTVFVLVPDVMQEELVSAGLLPEDEIQEKPESAHPKKPESKDELQKEVFAAFDLVIDANERESFSGTGIPKPAAVEKITGYTLNNAELKDLWGKYLTEKRS